MGLKIKNASFYLVVHYKLLDNKPFHSNTVNKGVLAGFFFFFVVVVVLWPKAHIFEHLSAIPRLWKKNK